MRRGVYDYKEPQAEGGTVNPDEDPARRTKSGTPPWENGSDSEAGRVAILLAQDFEDEEATSPLEALKQEGFEVLIVSAQESETLIGKGKKAKLESSVSVEKADPDEFVGLIIPGGRSPEKLRALESAVKFVRHFVERKKPIAAICHGPQLLISAGGIESCHLTGHESIAVDLENAQAEYHDRPVVVDGNLVTSRKPEDLDCFNREMIKLFKERVLS